MRKINPADVRADFQKQLSGTEDFYRKGMSALTGDADRSTLAGNTLLILAVQWEGIVNDMFIAYINRDATQFKESIRNAFNEEIRDSGRPKLVFETFGKLEIPDHLTKSQVQDLADLSGNNITFSNFDKLQDRARSWLVAQDAQRFTGLSARQKETVNAMIALRNHLAHRSKRSLDAMNKALEAGALYNSGLQRATNRINLPGSWLKARPPNKQVTRLELFLEELKRIGAAV